MNTASEVLSFVHGSTGIMLYSGARLVVRHAAFYTPFRGWRHLDGVPSSERPPAITGVWFEGAGTVVMDHVICEGLKHCLLLSDGKDATVTITNSLFMDTYQAIYDRGWVTTPRTVKSSVFFRNDMGASLDCRTCRIEGSLFLQNNIGVDSRGSAQYKNSAFVQNGQAVYCSSWCWQLFEDLLFFKNDIAYVTGGGTWRDATFLDNRISMRIGVATNLQRVNFLGSAEDYHLYYTGAALYDLDASSICWNTTSVEVVQSKIYDAMDGSGRGLVRLLNAESLPDTPFQHSMFSNDSCAGQCGQQWYNRNWSSLIGAGTGTFGFFDAEGELQSGQSLQDALLGGYEPTADVSLNAYMLDVSNLLEAVGAYQTVGTTTSPLPSTSSSTTTSTTTTTTTLAAQLLVGASIVMSEPSWLFHDTTWRAEDGVRALAKQVTILPDVTLTIEGDANSTAVLTQET